MARNSPANRFVRSSLCGGLAPLRPRVPWSGGSQPASERAAPSPRVASEGTAAAARSQAAQWTGCRARLPESLCRGLHSQTRAVLHVRLFAGPGLGLRTVSGVESWARRFEAAAGLPEAPPPSAPSPPLAIGAEASLLPVEAGRGCVRNTAPRVPFPFSARGFLICSVSPEEIKSISSALSPPLRSESPGHPETRHHLIHLRFILCKQLSSGPRAVKSRSAPSARCHLHGATSGGLAGLRGVPAPRPILTPLPRTVRVLSGRPGVPELGSMSAVSSLTVTCGPLEGGGRRHYLGAPPAPPM